MATLDLLWQALRIESDIKDESPEPVRGLQPQRFIASARLDVGLV
jgi:hypothetical protein